MSWVILLLLIALFGHRNWRMTLIALDQIFNTRIGPGYADETLSARAWRKRNERGWGPLQRVIDWLFFWQDSHCENSFYREQRRMHLPRFYR